MGYDFAEADMEKAFVSMQELDCGNIFVNIMIKTPKVFAEASSASIC